MEFYWPPHSEQRRRIEIVHNSFASSPKARLFSAFTVFFRSKNAYLQAGQGLNLAAFKFVAQQGLIRTICHSSTPRIRFSVSPRQAI
jgi:hypothetical protein